MGDMGDIFNDMKADLREKKAKYGIDCPGCRKVQPKRTPSRLLPGWKCKVCGFIAPKREIPISALNEAITKKETTHEQEPRKHLPKVPKDSGLEHQKDQNQQEGQPDVASFDGWSGTQYRPQDRGC